MKTPFELENNIYSRQGSTLAHGDKWTQIYNNCEVSKDPIVFREACNVMAEEILTIMDQTLKET